MTKFPPVACDIHDNFWRKRQSTFYPDFIEGMLYRVSLLPIFITFSHAFSYLVKKYENDKRAEYFYNQYFNMLCIIESYKVWFKWKRLTASAGQRDFNLLLNFYEDVSYSINVSSEKVLLFCFYQNDFVLKPSVKGVGLVNLTSKLTRIQRT